MDLITYEEPKPQGKIVRLKLVQCALGRLQLIAVDESGVSFEGGFLLDIDEKGIHLIKNVKKSLLFSTDSLGRLMVR